MGTDASQIIISLRTFQGRAGDLCSYLRETNQTSKTSQFENFELPASVGCLPNWDACIVIRDADWSESILLALHH